MNKVVTVSVCLKEATAYAEAGHEIAFGQRVIEAVKEEVKREVKEFNIAEGDVNVELMEMGLKLSLQKLRPYRFIKIRWS